MAPEKRFACDPFSDLRFDQFVLKMTTRRKDYEEKNNLNQFLVSVSKNTKTNPTINIPCCREICRKLSRGKCLTFDHVKNSNEAIQTKQSPADDFQSRNQSVSTNFKIN